MATRATITCANCGNSFHVFWNSFNEETEIECPYCDRKLDQKFNRYLRMALGSTWELNKELVRSHHDYNTDLFSVNIETIYVPIEKFRLSRDE